MLKVHKHCWHQVDQQFSMWYTAYMLCAKTLLSPLEYC